MTDLRTAIYDCLEEIGIDRSIAARCIHKLHMSFGELVDKALEAMEKDCPKTYFLTSIKAGKLVAGSHRPGWDTEWIIGHETATEIYISDGARRGRYHKFKYEVVWDQ